MDCTLYTTGSRELVCMFYEGCFATVSMYIACRILIDRCESRMALSYTIILNCDAFGECRY